MEQPRKKQRLMTPEEVQDDVTILAPAAKDQSVLRPAKIEIHRHCRRDETEADHLRHAQKVKRHHLQQHSRHSSSRGNHLAIRQESSLDTALSMGSSLTNPGDNVASMAVSAALQSGSQESAVAAAQPQTTAPVMDSTPPVGENAPIPMSLPEIVTKSSPAEQPNLNTHAQTSASGVPTYSRYDNPPTPTRMQETSLQTDSSGALVDTNPARMSSTTPPSVSDTVSAAAYGAASASNSSTTTSTPSSSQILSSGAVSSGPSNSTASSTISRSTSSSSSSSSPSSTTSSAPIPSSTSSRIDSQRSTPSASSSISTTPTSSATSFFGMIPVTDSYGSATSSGAPQSSTTFMTSSRTSSSTLPSSSSTTTSSISSTSLSSTSASSTSDSSSGIFYGSGAGDNPTVSAAAAPTGGATSSQGSGASSSVPTPQVVGGVVGGLAGLSILLVAALLFMKWYKKRKAAAANAIDAGSAASGGVPDQPETSQDPRAAAAVAGAIPAGAAAGGFMRRLSRPREPPTVPGQERGFERVSGRKLPSQFSPGIEGPSAAAAGASATNTSGSKSSGYPSGGTFLSTGSVENPFSDQAPTSTSAAPVTPVAGSATTAAAGVRGTPSTDKERFMPGPARTPVLHSVENTRSSHLAHLAAPSTSARGITRPPRPSMARSAASYDSSRNSRFTEDFV